MKIRSKTEFRVLRNKDYFLIYPDGTPKPFWVDKKFLLKLVRIPWRFIPGKDRARGFFGVGHVRQYLHRYVVHLANKYYPEVNFGNGDPFDCRLVNLKPYRREEELAHRRIFKNNTSRRKGVCYHKRKKKWAAMIRVHGKLRHLGYHDNADAAARAYARAWNLAHPKLKPVPV